MKDLDFTCEENEIICRIESVSRNRSSIGGNVRWAEQFELKYDRTTKELNLQLIVKANPDETRAFANWRRFFLEDIKYSFWMRYDHAGEFLHKLVQMGFKLDDYPSLMTISDDCYYEMWLMKQHLPKSENKS